jgi:hypothetical protein
MVVKRFRYPKLTLFGVIIVLAYLVFHRASSLFLFASGYLGSFFGGVFYTFGFTSPFAAAYFISQQVSHPLIFAIIGAFGALIADYFIFSFIRFSVMDEFSSLEKHLGFDRLSRTMDHYRITHFFKVGALFVLAIALIASPLPDEIGVVILAGLTKLRPFAFGFISFFANFLGIYTILYF